MKALSLILNIILFIAVGILFYFHFNNNTPSAEVGSQIEEESTSELKIAYINADTVLSNYDFFKEKQTELENKQKQMDKEFRNRAQGLQNEVNNFQQTVSNLTIGQAKALEEDLMKKQNNLRLYQESLTQELMKAEAEINKELYEKITSYIKDYSNNNDIELVVKYNQGSDVLYAGEAMDITREIVKGLNSRYQEESIKDTASK